MRPSAHFSINGNTIMNNFCPYGEFAFVFNQFISSITRYNVYSAHRRVLSTSE